MTAESSQYPRLELSSQAVAHLPIVRHRRPAPTGALGRRGTARRPGCPARRTPVTGMRGRPRGGRPCQPWVRDPLLAELGSFASLCARTRGEPRVILGSRIYGRNGMESLSSGNFATEVDGHPSTNEPLPMAPPAVYRTKTAPMRPSATSLVPPRTAVAAVRPRASARGPSPSSPLQTAAPRGVACRIARNRATRSAAVRPRGTPGRRQFWPRLP